MKKYKKGSSVICIIIMLPLLSVLFTPVSSLNAVPQDNIRSDGNGILDLTEHDFSVDGTVKLNCKWEFFWNRLIEPGSKEWNETASDHGFYSVPLFWTAYPGHSFPSVGYGTYRLIIKTNGKYQNLALKTPEIFTEYRLWINGKIMDQHGTIAKTKTRFLKPAVYTFYTDSKKIEIVLQIKNSLHVSFP